MAKAPQVSLPSRLKTQQLMLVAALDEHRSVLRAAQALHMTQPAASKLLHQLETTVGVALFVRHARGVEPTAYGEILVRHARAALAELRNAQDEVSALRSGLSGQVAIGTEATSATTLVPRAVALLKQRFPRVSVSIELAFSEMLVSLLRTGKLDIAVARLQNVQELAELHYEPLADTPHAMVARARHPLAGQRRLWWRDLALQTWVVPPQGNVLRSCLTLLFLEQDLAFPKQVVETAALPVIISLLEISDMVAPLPTEVARPHCGGSGPLALLPIRLDLRLGPAGIVTRRDQSLSPGAQAMLRTLREVAEQVQHGWKG
jgi:DNA-binding transcriptional LysR family regulator